LSDLANIPIRKLEDSCNSSGDRHRRSNLGHGDQILPNRGTNRLFRNDDGISWPHVDGQNTTAQPTAFMRHDGSIGPHHKDSASVPGVSRPTGLAQIPGGIFAWYIGDGCCVVHCRSPVQNSVASGSPACRPRASQYPPACFPTLGCPSGY